MVRVSIQGDAASFHDIAAEQFFGKDSERVFCDTFGGTVGALTNNKVEYALCAIENSLYGSINEVYDLILKNELFICGEVYLRIEQCLIGLPDAKLGNLTAVYSHPVALAQCDAYLDANLHDAKRLEYHDTAASVEMIKQLNDPTVVAIASREAAEMYDMEIIAESIETNKENYTRFVVLTKPQSAMVKNANKTSLIVRTNHTPGALYAALGSFAKRAINLSKIQSRPIVGKAWHYMFYIDIDIGMNDDAYKEAVDELSLQGCEVILAGSYTSGR